MTNTELLIEELASRGIGSAFDPNECAADGGVLRATFDDGVRTGISGYALRNSIDAGWSVSQCADRLVELAQIERDRAARVAVDERALVEFRSGYPQ